MHSSRPPTPPSRTAQTAAFAVHIFTALGAGIALLAMLSAVRADWSGMFAWLGLALVVDGIDGPLARKLDVARVLPDWSGDALDFVVDFITYVFVPAYAIIVREAMPASQAATRVGIVILGTIAGMSLGGWLSGAIFDATGSYRAAFINGIGWNLFNVGIVTWLLLRSRKRASLVMRAAA